MPIYVRVDTTAVQVKKDNLLLRLDLYIDEPLSKSYKQQYVYVPVIPDGTIIPENPDDSWLTQFPHIWRLNPVLCGFITVPESIVTLSQSNLGKKISEYVGQLYNPDVVATLDDIIVRQDSIHYVSVLMKDRGKYATSKVATADAVDLVSSLITKLGTVTIPLSGDGNILAIEPGTIDAGTAAIDRAAARSANNTTLVVSNPTNANGTFDTFEIWLATNCSTVKVGTWYGSGTSYSCREFYNAGAQVSGSKQTISGVSVDAQTNDMVGELHLGGTWELTVSGGTGCYSVAGDQTDGGSDTYTLQSAWELSLYATGTESGGVTGSPATIMQMMSRRRN